MIYTKIRQYTVRKRESCLEIKYSINATGDERVDLFKSGRRASDFKVVLEMEHAYSENNALDGNKVEDLIDMCDSKIIPEAYHEFYRNITTAYRRVAHQESEYDTSNTDE